MKYFSMDGRIDKDMVERFIIFYNDHCFSNCTIVMNTVGGDTYKSETIIHMINQMPKCTLLIMAAYSVGLEIAINVKCKKLLSKTAKGMWHYGRCDTSVNVKGKPYYHEDECLLRNLPIERKSAERIAKKIMTQKELKDFKEDKDIYFDYFRMREIFLEAGVM